MQTIRKIFKPAALLLALHVLMLSGPYHTVSAAMIGTEAMIHIDRGQQTRDRLHHHLLRDDIKSLLESRGIDPLEVQARIDSMSDAELDRIAGKLDALPAGKGGFETVIIVLFLIFLILLITDIAGYTDVFPFVNKHAAGSTSRTAAPVEAAAQPQANSPVAVAGINPDQPLTVYFKSNSNDLTASAYERLDRVALYMAKRPETRLKIKGFSDSTGTSSYDSMVSEIRANTVKNYLIAKGVAPSNISTAAAGSQDLAAGSAGEDKSRMASRVVIEFK